jgi:RNA polymerase sigma factor (sigma-70 family)
MPSPPSDAEIIARSLAEPEAFAAIFDRHNATVHGYLRRRLGSEVADDLLAETFAQAFRGRVRYVAQHDTCRAWLLGVTAHLIANHRRAERRRLAALQRECGRRARAADELDGVLGRATAGELSEQLAKGLRRLESRDREVLLLYAWAELSYAEIAEALDIAVGTVRSRLHRAREQLRGYLPPPPDLPLTSTLRTGDTHAP